MDIFGKNLNDDNHIESGNFLLAEPLLFDPNFQRTVILLCEHNERGSFGLVINKEANVVLEDMEKHPHLHENLYIGGPVQPNTLHYIHTFEHLEGAIPIKDGLFWGGDYEQIRILFQQGVLNKNNCRFFIGYSGWAANQLEEELEQNSWVISGVNLSVVFKTDADNLWKTILHKMGGKYRILMNYPEDPSLN